MKKTVSLFLLICLLFSLVSCSSEIKIEPLGGLHLEEGDVYPQEFLTFNGKAVTFTEFRYYYLNYRDMYLASDPDYFSREGAEEELKNEVLQALLDEWGVRLLAESYKVELDREEKSAVSEDIAEVVSIYGGEEAFAAELATSYMARGHYEKLMQNATLTDKLFQTLFAEGGDGAFSQEEIIDYFKEHYLAVQQIYLPFEEGEKEGSCEKTAEKAAEILKELEEGADFWELVKTKGKDEMMLDFPDGYYITEGYSQEVLYEEAKKLEEGEVSSAIVSTGGIHILKRLPMKEERMLENSETALFGYTDPEGNSISGAYDEVFYRLYHEKGQTITVKYSDYWDKVSTKTVY